MLVVPCYPIYSLLLATNVTRMDFFSLHVDGVERGILKSIPIVDKVDIRTLAVETKDARSKKEIYFFMESNGCRVEKHIKLNVTRRGLWVDV